MAIAAVDVALWDLKARLLELPLCRLLGAVRESVPIYGSGGFTSYDDRRLQEQLSGWVERGIPRVKMKVGVGAGARPAARAPRAPGDRRGRRAVRRCQRRLHGGAGARARRGLRRAGLGVAGSRSRSRATISPGCARVRERVPAGMAVAAGEYGYDLPYFARMLDAEAVDVQQADVTRCAGITELLRVDALCRARGRPLSLHCGPVGPRPRRGGAVAVRAPRVLPRSRADRADALRRRARAARRRAVARPRRRRAWGSSSSARGAGGRRMTLQVRRRSRTCAPAAASRSCAPRPPGRRCRLSVEVYVNHYSGSFANKWMWAPVGLLPALGPGRARRDPLGARGAHCPAGDRGLDDRGGRVRNGPARPRHRAQARRASARPRTTSSPGRRCWHPGRWRWSAGSACWRRSCAVSGGSGGA